MNTLFIRLFFTFVCIIIFLHVLSFSIFEIKTNHNVFGGILTIVVTIGGIVFSNFIFWIN